MDALEKEQADIKADGKCGEESPEHYGIAPRRVLFCGLPKKHKGKHSAVRNDHGLKIPEEW